ncbi:DEAD/DEAH box helicase [Clostridium botulinum]|uniref:DEAD/DEAH box helicase n=1 Tax=Clostridium botulinum TaxID=1491 RepID=UPI0007746606|nr:DEAD/DEAH box helicase [Clostridium botulinum]NFH80189.1 DEAD/DEAH box helicase [Clostridium botulinum]NFH81918.1 DEAD/DEAH box helicase [Clostridium botulinum]NFI09892.1 DEAD/DEAH box helicase [Clostridium botulinum]NFI14951.1 DEAD/DEAH box helicase [Clostridium botulinum]NFO85033.1 DEAD/DEAH box helicase [Clostridium botulinum]
MYSDKLKKYMHEFKITQLKYFLGDNLIKILIEWVPHYENLFTRGNIIDMIDTIYGVNLFKNKEFRKELLFKFSNDEILSFKDILQTENDDIKFIIDQVSNRKWGNNAITVHFLEILNMDKNEIIKEKNTEIEEVNIEAYDRFFELLDYQFIIKQKVLNIINSDIPVPRILVHMPTGTGKTKTTMHTIVNHYNFNLNKKGLIIWMAHTTELLQQAYETLEITWKHIGMGSSNIYRLWENHNLEFEEDEGINGFLLCGFQKIISVMKNNPKLFNKLCKECTLVVVDEAHKAVANETKKVIDELIKQKQGMCSRALLGLTATPGRNINDSENKLLVNMFENRIISIDTDILNTINLDKFKLNNSNLENDVIKYLQNRKILAIINRKKLVYDTTLSVDELNKLKIQATANGYEDFSKDFLKVIGQNKKRNMKILNKLIELDMKKMPTIVFACSVEQGKLLSSALSLEGIKNGCVFGEMDSQQRQEIIKKFKDRSNDMNILINYEVLTTGFDATNIQCVFITRPTQSIVLYSQMIGRGLRGPKMGGNEQCLLIDIEDNLDRYCSESMAFSYFKNYWNN